MSEKKLRILFLLLWVPLVLGAYLVMVLYGATPTYVPTIVPAQARSGVPLGAFSKRQEFHVFLHPQCVCSLATLAGVRKIRERSSVEDLKVVLHFLLPEQAPESFAQGNLLKEARRLPEVELVVEKDSALARQHKVLVSGQALFFDQAGSLRFNGGLTPERGCEGDSSGIDAVLALVHRKEPEVSASPVYGCPINHCPQTTAHEQGVKGVRHINE